MYFILDTLEQELKEYERTKSSKYDAYGREMGKIMDRINKEKWVKIPRGPMGTCITVKVSNLRIAEFP